MVIASLLFGISASLDALLVGISYGIRRVRICFWQNLVISLVTLLGTCLSVGLGRYLAAFLPDMVSDYAGCLVLILLGVYYIFKWMRHRSRPKEPEESVQESGNASISSASCTTDFTVQNPSARTCVPSGICPEIPGAQEPDSESGLQKLPHLNASEVLSLGLVLSLNNLSAGFSASLAGLPFTCAAVSTFLCSVFFLSSGNRLGGSPLLQLAGRAADPLSGAFLIGLGIIQLFF